MRSPGTSNAAGIQSGDGTGCTPAPAPARAAAPQSPGTVTPPKNPSLEGICLHCELPQIANCGSNVLLQPRELFRVSHGHVFFGEPLSRGSFAQASQRIPRLCLFTMGEGFHFSLSTLAALLRLGSAGAEAGASVQPRAGWIHMSSPHRCDYRGIYSSLVFSGKQHVKDLGARREHKAGAKPPDGSGELGFTPSRCSISLAVLALLLLCRSRALVG